jgi:hypothetical protein
LGEQEEEKITNVTVEGPCIGILLDRERKARERKLELPKELNTVERLNQVPWLKQVYDRSEQALVWQEKDGKVFKAIFAKEPKMIKSITYYGLDRQYRLSDGTLINQDEAHLLMVS